MSHKWQWFLFHISVCYQHLCCKHLSHKLNQIYLKLFNVSVHKNFTLNVQRLASQSEDQCGISTLVDVSIMAKRTVTKITKEVKELEVYIIIASGNDALALLVGDSEEVLQRARKLAKDWDPWI